jgi:hypothetical protein
MAAFLIAQALIRIKLGAAREIVAAKSKPSQPGCRYCFASITAGITPRVGLSAGGALAYFARRIINSLNLN